MASHLQVKRPGQTDVFAGETAVGMGDGQRVLTVGHIASGEQPQRALGVCAFDGDDVCHVPHRQ